MSATGYVESKKRHFIIQPHFLVKVTLFFAIFLMKRVKNVPSSQELEKNMDTSRILSGYPWATKKQCHPTFVRFRLLIILLGHSKSARNGENQ